MDDTKNMIERYKRELMEMMKTAPQPAPEPVKQPRVIGYVEDDVRVPDEYGRLISEISDDFDENADEVDIADEFEEQPEILESEAEPNLTDEEMSQGSRATPAEFQEPQYESYEQFTDQNTGRGTITFRVYTAREAVPIKGAECVLSKRIGETDHEIAAMLTDESGQTPPQTLPTPSKELSQHVENNIQPFALYDATVKSEGFADVILRDIPVFDGVQSIQRVSMIPNDGSETEEITEVQNANE